MSPTTATPRRESPGTPPRPFAPPVSASEKLKTTKAMTPRPRVAMASAWLRSRKVAPTSTARRTAARRETASAGHGEQPAFTVSTLVPYIPIP